ncbi:UvrD-helicase domain-containing protein [Ammoniphilus sp. 3BR4]|uniref:UvrD-helicase domain-containing protein n=1 Tax=Ammoniphilus sp. 3BR4 TaxID=3158265 RepID=UPI003465FD98
MSLVDRSMAAVKKRQLVEAGFNPQQVSAVTSEHPLVVISAGAGSGKTRVLTERYVYICENELTSILEGHPYPMGAGVEQIVAITFTKKAAREMRERISQALHAKKKEATRIYQGKEQEHALQFWTEQIEGLASAPITTFHSFCQKLLQEHAFEADVLPSFAILDDVESKLLQAGILDEMWEDPKVDQATQPLFAFYSKASLQSSIQEVYAQLRESAYFDLKQAFDTKTIIDIPLQMEYSEKQRLMAEFCLQAPHHLQALKHGLAMREEKESKGKKKSTSETPAHLRRIIALLEGMGDNAVQSPAHWYSECQEAIPALAGAWKTHAPELYHFIKSVWSPVKSFWEDHPNLTQESIDELKVIIRLFADLVHEFHQRYERIKRDRGVLDFSDLQRKGVDVLSDVQVAGQCRKKYKHFMVDEFQDTNPLQMQMLQRIQPAYRFIVGDGKQSIYRFRGADVSLLKEYMKEAAVYGSDESLIDMSVNYRTSQGIIDFINQIFANILGSEPSDLPYKIHYSPLIAHRDSEVEGERRVELLKISEPDPQDSESDPGEPVDEYDSITSRMVDVYQGGVTKVYREKTKSWVKPGWSDMAILIPSRTQLTQLEMSLQKRNIPYVVYGGIGFYEKQEVIDFLTFLQWINRPWEELYIFSILRGPLFGLTINDLFELHSLKKEAGLPLSALLYEKGYQDRGLPHDLLEKLDRFYAFFEKWIPYTHQTGIRRALFNLFEDSGLRLICLLQPNGLQKTKNVEKLIRLLEGLYNGSIDQMLNQINRLIELSEKEGEAEVELEEGDCVHIMTVHASKGLEFPVVFVPNLSKRLQPDRGSLRFHKEHRLLVSYKKDDTEHPHQEQEIKSPFFKALNAKLKDEALEESKRLFYVAATRARDYLVLSASAGSGKETEEESGTTWYKMLQYALGQMDGYGGEAVLSIIPNHVHQRIIELDTREYPGPTQSWERAMPITFSVTEVMEFMDNPQTYYQRHILKINPEWLKEASEEGEFSGIDAGELGTLVHRVCEWIDAGWDRDKAVREALDLVEGLNVRLYKKALESMVDSYRGIDQAVIGVPVENEWSFELNLNGVYIIGTIDKITRSDNGLQIIDLKTNRTNRLTDLISKYKTQLYLYKLAYESLNQGKFVETMSLFFLRDKEKGLIEIPYEVKYEEKVLQAIAKMADLKRRKAGRVEYR